jgi:hypothetical protein
MAHSDNFTVGRDLQAVLLAPNGTRIDLSKMTDFNHTPVYKTAVSTPLNSPRMERYLPDGHTLKFSIDRRDSSNEDVFSQIEAAWWAVGSADVGTAPAGSLFVYINEIDGSQITHQFRGVSLKFGGIGDAKSEAAIKQTVDGHAMYWTKL